MFLPGIIPRAKELGGSGFGYLAFLFATVYQAVKILPEGHPYARYDNMGKFTIRQVIAAAANNLEFKRGNIDQIIVFFAILAGIVLLAAQFILFLVMLFSGQAFAQDASAPFKSIFITEHPETDIAFLLLDYTFGIPEFFGSNALPGGPTPFHEGLHALFQFYNLAILLVGVLIFLYYVMVVVIETAQTGVPFGRRFAKIYAPLRLIAAVGLLVPLPTPAASTGGGEGGGTTATSSGSHFNAAQYITLYAAKLGSSFATNGWIVYNRELHNPTGADNASLVARANTPDFKGLLHFTSVYHACRAMYEINAYKKYLGEDKDTIKIDAYVIKENKAERFTGTGGEGLDYFEAKDYFKNSNMEVVLGELDEERHKSYAGSVYPYCGRMTISLSNDNPSFFKGSYDTGTGGVPTESKDGGVRGVENAYYTLVQTLLRTKDSSGAGACKSEQKFAALGERAAYVFAPGETRDRCRCSDVLGDAGTCETSPNWYPDIADLQGQIDDIKLHLDERVIEAYDDLRNNLDLDLSEELEKRGWGGAGMWYNNIAQVNGSLTATIYSLPEVRAYPEVLKDVLDEKQAQDSAIPQACKTFDPNLADGRKIDTKNTADQNIVAAMNDVYQYWACEKNDHDDGEGLTSGMTGNAALDAISAIFGINGLFELKANSKADEATGMPIVHPMASLSAIGRSLVENAIRNIGTSILFTAFGGLIGGLTGGLGGGLGTLSGMFVSIATIGLTAGFILYYILPFLPFLYFFFAVGAWVKSIFEAMVGVPLWALAHLKIDGDGFSGRAAANGYFLILEIMLRPIVTVFGLIGGMAIFAAMVATLNTVFDLVVSNIVGDTGGDLSDPVYSSAMEEFQRGVIDKFFFTIMYAILVYMMATSCFKMIDTIPKGFMRWIGSGVNTFNDNTSDPTANLTNYTAIAGSQFISPIVGGINKGVGGVAGLVGSLGAPQKGPDTNKTGSEPQQ